MIYCVPFDISRHKKSSGRVLVCPLPRENILVLDIFFEALNYEKIEQKKAYEIAGLLGKKRLNVTEINVIDLSTGVLSGPAHFTSRALVL